MPADLYWFAVDAKETLSDGRVCAWSLEEFGAFWKLLCHEWLDGSVPSDLPSIAKLLHVDGNAMRGIWSAIGDRFVPHLDERGRLANPRLEKYREEAQRKSKRRAEAGKKGATSRWDKVKARHSKRMRLPSATDNKGTAERCESHTDQEQETEQEEKKLARSLARAKPISGPEAEPRSDRPADAVSGPVQAATRPPSPGEPVAGEDGVPRSTDGGRDAAPSGDAPAALGRAAPSPEGGPPAPGAPRPVDEPPRRPVLLVDVTELPEAAARVRGELERRLGWRFDLAPGFAEEVERLGEDRALEIYATEAADYITRNAGKRIQSLAFFVSVGKRYRPPSAAPHESHPCAEWDAMLREYESLPAADRLAPTAFTHWIGQIRARMVEGVLVLTSPTADHAEHVAEQLLGGLKELAFRALKGAIEIRIEAAAEAAEGGA